jgi:hypothetical protein
MRRRKMVMVSIGLALGTFVLFTPLEMLPRGATISYWLTLPGNLIASIAYPEGLHSGMGYLPLAVACNLVIFAAVWFAVLSIFFRRP